MIDRLEVECSGLKAEGGVGFEEITHLNESLNQEIAGLRAAIVGQQGRPGDAEGEAVARERALVLQLEADLQAREAELEEARERRELSSAADGELAGVWTDPVLLTENQRLRADLDSSLRERRQLAARVQAWQQQGDGGEQDKVGPPTGSLLTLAPGP
jgi:hypothetical protein